MARSAKIGSVDSEDELWRVAPALQTACCARALRAITRSGTAPPHRTPGRVGGYSTSLLTSESLDLTVQLYSREPRVE
eukprot:2705542-Prymnesium_polylepis.1